MQVQILRQVRKLDANNLLILFSLFKDELENALIILDEQQLVKYEQKRGFMPTFYTTRDARYYVTNQSCTCQAFQNKMRKGGPRACKHVLAVVLSENCQVELPVRTGQAEYEETFRGFLRQLNVMMEDIELSDDAQQ